jgi:hypothetical protein
MSLLLRNDTPLRGPLEYGDMLLFAILPLVIFVTIIEGLNLRDRRRRGRGFPDDPRLYLKSVKSKMERQAAMLKVTS